MKARKDSLTVQVLLALVPYTRQNLELTFHPNKFFEDLERATGKDNSKLRAAYHRAKKQKLLMAKEGNLRLSLKARQLVQPHIAAELGENTELLVMFDIPEDFSHVRRELRSVLKMVGFQQVQKSVWTSRYDHSAILQETVEKLHADNWVYIYTANRVERQGRVS